MAKTSPTSRTTPVDSPAPESAAAQAQRKRLTRGKKPQPDALPPIPTPETAAAAPVVAAATPPTGGVEFIHIKACFPSPLNPRKTFLEEGIVEMMTSIEAGGLIQPLTGRAYTEMLENVPSAREIYVGGRRLRALDRLFETGRWPHDKLPDYRVPVIRRDVGDLELLQIALAENLNRSDMHPLEEGQALSEFRRRGSTLEEVAATYGKTPRWVQLRIQVAEELDDDTRALFQASKINFEAARELVRLPAEVRKGHVAAIQMDDRNYRTAADIRDRINQGLPEVKSALFKRDLYDGEIQKEGPQYGIPTERFSDVGQFRRLQQAAIAEKVAALKKEWSFVETFYEKKGRGSYFSQYDFLRTHKLDLEYGRPKPKQNGAVVVVFPELCVEIIENVCRGTAPTPPPKPTKAELKAADPVEAISTGRRLYAHQRKTAAFQAAMLRTGRRAATEMMVMALLGSGDAIGARPEAKGPDARHMHPDVVESIRTWRDQRLNPKAFEEYAPDAKGTHAYLEFKAGWGNRNSDERLRAYELIGALSDEDLDALFTVLVTARCGSFPEYGVSVSLGDQDLTVAMARRYGVEMKSDWQIDDAYLGTMDRGQLHALASKINTWCHLRDLDGLELKALQKAKVSEVRKMIAEHVRANGVRLVPPEMQFEPRQRVEADIRTWGEGGQVSKGAVQIELDEMIDKATDRQTVAETPVAVPAPGAPSESLITCPVDLPLKLEQQLDHALRQVAERHATSLDLRAPTGGEFVTLHRIGETNRLEVAQHHAADRTTYVGGAMVTKKLAAFLKAWLVWAELASPALDIEQLEAAKLLRMHNSSGCLPSRPAATTETAKPPACTVASPHDLLPPEILSAFAAALPSHTDFGKLVMRLEHWGQMLSLIMSSQEPLTYSLSVFDDGYSNGPASQFDEEALSTFVTRWLERGDDPAGCLLCNSAMGVEKALLEAAGAALPRHPDFGKSEIFLPAPNGTARLLLDASKTHPGEYWIIGFEGNLGSHRTDPTAVAETLRAWLRIVTPAETVEQPVDQAPNDATDAAIDELFNDPPDEEEDEKLPALQTIAFVVSEHATLPTMLLEAFADALPRHPDYGNPTLVIQAADGAQLTLTSDIVDDPTGDPDRHQITHYRDETVSVCGMTMPAARVEAVITAWLASLTEPSETAA